MRFIIFFATVFLLAGCHCPKNAAVNCDTLGTVRDYSGLDGCRFLIELQNGDKLNPVKIPEGFRLQDGQKITFSYNVLTDVMSICMAETQMVEITCIHETSEFTNACEDTMNPFAVAWMNKAFDRHNPTQILKYRNGEEWAYLFYAIPDSFLYDCHGNLICQSHGDAHDPCHRDYIDTFGKGKIIWQGEGVWD